MATGKSTTTAVNAVMKVLYPEGTVPSLINEEYKLYNSISKGTDFKGYDNTLGAVVALKTQNPQGVSNSVANAITALGTSTFNRFLLTRNKMFGYVNIDGEALEAAVRTDGALVDLLSNEVNGVAQTLVKDISVAMYNNGTGTLAQITAINHGTFVCTLASTTNMNWLENGMTVQFVSDQTLSPTIRGTYSYITSIDRVNKTFTMAADVAGATPNDWVVRYGFGCASATASQFYGLDSYVAGGAAPAALYGLTRSTDPARLAGQAQDGTGQAMEDVVLDLASKIAFQGVGTPDTLVANPIRLAQMKRSVGGKVYYNRTETSKTNVGNTIDVFETEGGALKVLSDPYCPLNTAYVLRKKDWQLWSLGAAPHLEKKDGSEYLRVYNDDAIEARWKFYGALKLTNPAAQGKITNFGL